MDTPQTPPDALAPGFKWKFDKLARTCAWMAVLFLTLNGAKAQFVELNTEVEISDWDYWFLADRADHQPREAQPPSIFTTTKTVHCLLGTNLWMIEDTSPTFRMTYWFTGTNILQHTVITKQPPDSVSHSSSEANGLVLSAPPAGHKYTHIYDSVDGNPGRPEKVPDVMGFDLPATISWLAFGSGPALKREPHRIFPPSPFWKESSLVYSGWSDWVDVFKDDLGLPRSLDLISTNGQSTFKYRVHQTTNICGWTIPLEFYGVQHLPTGTNGWKLHLTFKGKTTFIRPAEKPQIPAEVMDAIER